MPAGAPFSVATSARRFRSRNFLHAISPPGNEASTSTFSKIFTSELSTSFNESTVCAKVDNESVNRKRLIDSSRSIMIRAFAQDIFYSRFLKTFCQMLNDFSLFCEIIE
jgi:hypothetical protein